MRQINSNKSVKGISREYRKQMRAAGIPFPKSGAFHVRIKGGSVLAPADILLHPDTEIVSGPAPQTPSFVSRPLGYFGEEHDPFAPLNIPDELPALPTMYKRRISVAVRNGKEVKRTNYYECKNPKPGETYYIRETMANGKNRYTEKTFSKIVEREVA